MSVEKPQKTSNYMEKEEQAKDYVKNLDHDVKKLFTYLIENKIIIVENRTDDNGCTETGRLWFRTDV